ncbi:hypothetical protein BaRGS_00026321 [Batillaria attramentaria]|uniref:Sulfotransferase domain-containing protein n=1 Tax=Batillaria attramentaria TaxID=370345 RepID=A0ABD0K5M9_9CAEN
MKILSGRFAVKDVAVCALVATACLLVYFEYCNHHVTTLVNRFASYVRQPVAVNPGAEEPEEFSAHETGYQEAKVRVDDLAETLPAHKEINRDNPKDPVYNVPWMDEAYWRSSTAPLSNMFVGSKPLFPPCTDQISPGIPDWGPHPYMGPFAYVNRSKNPCWFDETHQLLCVPYFYLAGVSKSGTSDLFSRIIQHPEVIGSGKEHHWFDRRRYYKNQTFWEYARSFRKPTSVVKETLEKHDRSNYISGDATPSYFYDSYEWKQFSGNENCTEPRVILANQIRHLYPEAKVILIVRHPVNRLYSRYLFDYGRKPKERSEMGPQQFHNRVVDGLNKYTNCIRKWSLRHCVYNKTLWETVHQLRIAESMYSVLLEDWMRVFPRHQILFIRFEDYAKNITAELAKVFAFLELEVSGEQLHLFSQSHPKNRGQYHDRGRLLPETRAILERFYEPFIRRFASLVGDEKFLWKDI